MWEQRGNSGEDGKELEDAERYTQCRAAVSGNFSGGSGWRSCADCPARRIVVPACLDLSFLPACRSWRGRFPSGGLRDCLSLRIGTASSPIPRLSQATLHHWPPHLTMRRHFYVQYQFATRFRDRSIRIERPDAAHPNGGF
jgi:hypothetical protein